MKKLILIGCILLLPFTANAYDKTIWLDADDPLFIPGESPALSASNLNKIEQGIQDAESAGAGDMKKLVYDVDISGVVDDSEKVNGLTVETNVPIGALFTDTTYPDATATIGGVLTDAQAVKLNGALDEVSQDGIYLQGSGIIGDILTFSDDMQTALRFFVGTTFKDVQGNISSDGLEVKAQVEALGGGDIRYITSTGTNTLICTPSPQEITLIDGTDSVPQINYIYIDTPTNTLTVSTTSFPTLTEYVPLAVTYIGSANLVQNEGTYKTHKWSDHIYTEGDNGHMSHINKWIRSQHATWISGNALGYTGSGTSTINIYVSSGAMFQLHQHSTSQIVSPASTYIMNDEITPFLKTNNIASITTDSNGISINNRYAPLVVWYAHSELPNDAKLYINKPSGSYSSEADARSDAQKYSNFSIPTEFKGTAVLIHRLIIRNSGGVVTIYDGAGDDLRGTTPGSASGSSTSVGSTFLDSTFRVQNIADTTKQIDLDASNISTATIRTITMPDEDINLINVGNSIEVIPYAVNITLDLILNNKHKSTLTGNLTMNAPSNIVGGQSGYITLVQDVSGGRITTWDSVFTFLNTDSTDTSPNKINIYRYIVYSASKIGLEYVGTL